MSLKRFLLLEPKWIPTILFIPTLYALGWLCALAITQIGLEKQNVPIIGTIISFGLFVLTQPSWARTRWKQTSALEALGCIRKSKSREPILIVHFVHGLLCAITLLIIITIFILFGSWGKWLGELSASSLLNALALTFIVGICEELIFRGWLWGELEYLFGAKVGIVGQAFLYSIVHIKGEFGLVQTCGMLIGLFLLGIALGQRRIIDFGSIWGCIGLHGGLVGGWFLLLNNLIHISNKSPTWLLGGDTTNSNPIGGLISIGCLILIIIHQRKAFAMASFFFTGARSASLKSDTP